MLVAHAVGYLGAVFWVLAPVQAVAFVVVHQGLWGVYMGLAFAPNHKGMPVIPAGRRLDHLHKQVLTSRNVLGGRVLDVALGGLNYQIEHHLFPDLPSNRYADISVRVKELCAQYDIPYTIGPLHKQYGQALRTIMKLSLPNRFTSSDSPPEPPNRPDAVEAPPVDKGRKSDAELPPRRSELGGWSRSGIGRAS